MSLTDIMQSCNRSVLNSMEWNKMEGTGMEWNGMEWNGIMPECTVRERTKSSHIRNSEDAYQVIACPCIAW
jgi:hypothetical protein